MTWDPQKALTALNIDIVPFDIACIKDIRGYSSGREIAISPVEPYKGFVALHEIAHIVLGHTVAPSGQPSLTLSDKIWKELMMIRHEIEAHTVAMTAATFTGVKFNFDQEMDYLNKCQEQNAGIEIDETKLTEVVMQIVEAGNYGILQSDDQGWFFKEGAPTT